MDKHIYLSAGFPYFMKFVTPKDVHYISKELIAYVNKISKVRNELPTILDECMGLSSLVLSIRDAAEQELENTPEDKKERATQAILMNLQIMHKVNTLAHSTMNLCNKVNDELEYAYEIIKIQFKKLPEFAKVINTEKIKTAVE